MPVSSRRRQLQSCLDAECLVAAKTYSRPAECADRSSRAPPHRRCKVQAGSRSGSLSACVGSNRISMLPNRTRGTARVGNLLTNALACHHERSRKFALPHPVILWAAEVRITLRCHPEFSRKFALTQPCHPERSRMIRFADHPAESKDPAFARAVTGVSQALSPHSKPCSRKCFTPSVDTDTSAQVLRLRKFIRQANELTPLRMTPVG